MQWGVPVSDIYISLDEFAHYIAHRNIHPPMDYRMEFMLAQLTAIFVSAHQGKKGKKPKLSDFMLSAMMEEQKSDDDIASKVKATFSLFKRKE